MQENHPLTDGNLPTGCLWVYGSTPSCPPLSRWVLRLWHWRASMNYLSVGRRWHQRPTIQLTDCILYIIGNFRGCAGERKSLSILCVGQRRNQLPVNQNTGHLISRWCTLPEIVASNCKGPSLALGIHT